MQKKQYEIEVLVNGKPVKEYLKDGKQYIEGRKDTEFTLRVRNNSSETIVAVPTIDGISVMDGQPADFLSRGYIVNGNSSVTIDGWRTSLSEVAKFVFDSKDEAYSEKLGRGGNQGVIGLAVFKQKEDINKKILKELAESQKFKCHCGHGTCRHCSSWNFPHYPPIFGVGGGKTQKTYEPNITVTNDTLSMRAAGNTTCSNSFGAAGLSMMNASAAQAVPVNSYSVQTSDMGTAFGEAKASEVVEVTFDREDKPTVVMELYYASRLFLEDLGISFSKPATKIESSAFPGQFCQKP